MRKIISCRIIKSAPLGTGSEFQHYENIHDIKPDIEPDIKHVTYTNRRHIAETPNDDNRTSRILDLYI